MKIDGEAKLQVANREATANDWLSRSQLDAKRRPRASHPEGPQIQNTIFNSCFSWNFEEKSYNQLHKEIEKMLILAPSRLHIRLQQNNSKTTSRSKISYTYYGALKNCKTSHRVYQKVRITTFKKINSWRPKNSIISPLLKKKIATCNKICLFFSMYYFPK